MSKKTFIHAENNHNILYSKEVRLYNPPKPEEMKVIIWGKELCSDAEWNDFLKCVEEKTIEIDRLKQQLAEKDKEIDNVAIKTIEILKKVSSKGYENASDNSEHIIYWLFTPVEVKKTLEQIKELKGENNDRA